MASEADAVLQSADRVRRLGLLIRLRKLYRNLLRADGLLAQAAPVYRPPAELPGVLPAAVAREGTLAWSSCSIFFRCACKACLFACSLPPRRAPRPPPLGLRQSTRQALSSPKPRALTCGAACQADEHGGGGAR